MSLRECQYSVLNVYTHQCNKITSAEKDVFTSERTTSLHRGSRMEYRFVERLMKYRGHFSRLALIDLKQQQPSLKFICIIDLNELSLLSYIVYPMLYSLSIKLLTTWHASHFAWITKHHIMIWWNLAVRFLSRINETLVIYLPSWLMHMTNFHQHRCIVNRRFSILYWHPSH